MIKKMILILASSMAVACNSSESDTPKPGQPAVETPPVSNIHCYRYESPADTISLQVVQDGEAVTGTLVYKLKEKDKNEGTIRGTMKGDLLYADYTFMSEAVSSTRQVAFKQDGNDLLEGFGESVDQNGRQVFKNPDSLQFNTNMKLVQTDCR